MTTMTEVDPRQVLRSQVRAQMFEFRAAAEPGGEPNDGRTLEGYAAVFDQPTTIEAGYGDYEEVVKPGAFKRTLKARMPVMQFNHGNDKRTGETPIGSIEDLHEDDEGLFVRARLFDNELVEPIRQAIEGRAIRGMSFKFRVANDVWFDREGKKLSDDEVSELLREPGDRGPIRRDITEVQLFELGPVVFPAYEQTSVGVRSFPEGSRFDPNALAIRGVLAQFGLTERCVHGHLEKFNTAERQALAAEIMKTFPELRDLLSEPAPDENQAPVPREARADETSEPADDGTSDEPADSATPSPTVEVAPAPARSAFLREPAGWHLPDNPYRKR